MRARLTLANEEKTAHFGAVLATELRSGDVVTLSGPLGSGKTALARNVIRSLAQDIDIGAIPSPTFALVLTYHLPRAMLWHFDLYRIRNSDEILELGLDEALEDGISLIEWPERLKDQFLPAERLDIVLKPCDIGAEEEGTSRPIRADLCGAVRWDSFLSTLGDLSGMGVCVQKS